MASKKKHRKPAAAPPAASPGAVPPASAPSPSRRTPKPEPRGAAGPDWMERLRGTLRSLSPSRTALAILAAAFLMRFPDLGSKSLWIDEMVDWEVVEGPWSGVFATAHTVPYILSKWAFVLGHNEFMLRLPGAVVAWLGVWWIHLAAKRTAGETAGLLAAAMLALSPFHLYYSQDSHYYGMMMGFSCLVMLSMVRMTEEKSALWAGTMFAAAYLAYKTHPAAIFVPAACLGTFGLWIVTDRSFLRRALAPVMRASGPAGKAAAWGGSAAAALLALYVLYKLDRRVILAMTSGEAQQVESTPNFEISPVFFAKAIRDYLGGLYDYGAYNLAVASAMFLAALWGLGWLAAGRHWIAAYLVMILVGPWIALSVKKYEHFFHLRYLSFIVPGLILAAAAGLDSLGRLAARPFGLGEGAGSESGATPEAGPPAEGEPGETASAPEGLAAPAPPPSTPPASRPDLAAVLAWSALAVWALALTPNLLRYYRGEKQDWKGAMRTIVEKAEPGARLVNFLHCNQVAARFYLDYFARRGFDAEGRNLKFIKLRETSGAWTFALAQLKAMAREPGPLYVFSSYQRYEPPGLFDWIRENFELVFDGPTLHPGEFNFEGKNVEVYRLREPGRLFEPPYPLELGEADLRTGETDIRADRFGPVHLEAETADGEAARLEIDGREIPMAPVPGRAGVFSGETDLEAGGRRIRLTSSGGSPAKRLRVSARLGESFQYMADAPRALNTSIWNWRREQEGRGALVMKRNSSAGYDIVLPEGDERFLEIEARHDDPPPVVVEAALDGVSLGVIAYGKGNDSWEKLGLPFRAGPGLHRLEISFLNEGNVSDGLPESEDRDAWLHAIEVHHGPRPEKRDMRFPVPKIYAPPPGTAQAALDWDNPNARRAWSCTVAGRLDYVPDPWGSGRTVARLKATPPNRNASVRSTDPESQPVLFHPLPLKVEEGQVLYFSTYLRMEKLENYSANLVIMWFDEKGKLLQQTPANQEGITMANSLEEDFGWIRMAAFTQIPPGPARAVPAVWLYRNGRMPSDETGWLYVKPYRFESTKP